MQRALGAMSEHWEVTTALLLALVTLSIIGGVTLSSIWEDTAKSVCFAHHSPAECDPTLRVRSPEEVGRLNEMYLRCMSEHSGANAQSICSTLYEH